MNPMDWLKGIHSFRLVEVRRPEAAAVEPAARGADALPGIGETAEAPFALGPLTAARGVFGPEAETEGPGEARGFPASLAAALSEAPAGTSAVFEVDGGDAWAMLTHHAPRWEEGIEVLSIALELPMKPIPATEECGAPPEVFPKGEDRLRPVGEVRLRVPARASSPRRATVVYEYMDGEEIAATAIAHTPAADGGRTGATLRISDEADDVIEVDDEGNLLREIESRLAARGLEPRRRQSAALELKRTLARARWESSPEARWLRLAEEQEAFD